MNEFEITKYVEAISKVYNISKTSNEFDSKKFLESVSIAIKIGIYKFSDVEIERIKIEAEKLCRSKYSN